jgi:hypothetical protein
VTSKGRVACTQTTKESAHCIGEKLTTTGHAIRTAIPTLTVPVPRRPVAPVEDATTKTIVPADAETFKQEVQMHVQMRAAFAAAMKSLCDLLWGQCGKLPRSRLRSFNDHPTHSQDGDSLALLKGIQAEMTGFACHVRLDPTLESTNLTPEQQPCLLDCWGGVGTKQIDTGDKTLTRVLLSMLTSNNNGNREGVSAQFSRASVFGAVRHCFVFHE